MMMFQVKREQRTRNNFEGFETPAFFDEKYSSGGRKQPVEKKGVLTQYLTSVGDEQLVHNTLTGFLINLLKESGPLSIEKIMIRMAEPYPNLRKPNGKLYGPNMARSVKAALTANGIFELVEKRGAKRKLKTLEKEKTSMVWRVNKEAADLFIQQELLKFVRFNFSFL